MKLPGSFRVCIASAPWTQQGAERLMSLWKCFGVFFWGLGCSRFLPHGPGFGYQVPEFLAEIDTSVSSNFSDKFIEISLNIQQYLRNLISWNYFWIFVISLTDWSWSPLVWISEKCPAQLSEKNSSDHFQNFMMTYSEQCCNLLPNILTKYSRSSQLNQAAEAAPSFQIGPDFTKAFQELGPLCGHDGHDGKFHWISAWTFMKLFKIVIFFQEHLDLDNVKKIIPRKSAWWFDWVHYAYMFACQFVQTRFW